MRKVIGWMCGMGLILGLSNVKSMAAPPEADVAKVAANWTQCGWGGGGFYWSAAFDPTQDGVIYMGGDVLGVYKTEDHGRHWRMINNGIASYGVFSLVVDPRNHKTIYASNDGGLCKSTDGGEQWQLLPRTGPKDLHITGEKRRTIRNVAVDPTDSNIVYAASPAGKVYKSTDGGQSWKAVYERQVTDEDPAAARVQFGKTNGEWFGGIWMSFEFPKGVKTEDCAGFGFRFKGDGSHPDKAFMTLTTSSGASYASKDLGDIFKDNTWRDVVLTAKDFTLDAGYAKKNPDKAQALATVDWSTVTRMDFSSVGPLPEKAYVCKLEKVFFAMTRGADGQTATADQPILSTVREFSKDKTIHSYGNIHIGNPENGTIYSVAVAPKEPALVLAATQDAGMVLSPDGGQTWSELKTPKCAWSVAVAPSDANIIYGAFDTDGVWKSTDKGQTWTNLSKDLPKGCSIVDVAVSSENPLDVYAIGAVGWGGSFFLSHDGGQTWKNSSAMKIDADSADPTLPGDAKGGAGLSATSNLAINPRNPKELFISANWRSCLSTDSGETWTERMRGADISCVYDVRFNGGRTYASAMDEGTFVSDNNGEAWRQLWPLKYDPNLSGHNWRLAISDNGKGADHIISTVSPWDMAHLNHVVVSDDGGKTYKAVTAGLPDYVIQANTMWGMGFARALAADPKDPKVVYLGIDGDATPGKSGGGIFKSEDGGYNWKQLPNQPACRRMFFGLAVDPTDSKRLFWGCCGTDGGVYRSEDGGASWQHVFSGEPWVFNIVVAADGAVYCPGSQLWKSTDHGTTWKQITKLPAKGRTIVAMEVDPRDSKTMWIATTTWDGNAEGAVYKTSDGGATWQDITGNIGCCKPLVLRFNPATNELWAAGPGLYKLKQ